ncbi:MAG: tetratricopeptide repeat protein [Phaeospirillum sp.]|nr:tetratricopeptide repeat protein [Phaeospirillum sp.]
MRTAAFVAALLAFGMPLASLAETAKPAKAKPPAKVAKPTAESRLATLIAAASRGEGDAQFQLARAYRDGTDTKVDTRAALAWFELAAVNGHVQAAIEAAKAHQNGHGVKADPGAAGQWWYHAAVLGDTAARDLWLSQLLSGKITSLGGDRGLEWITEKAQGGNLKAIMILAEALENGTGIAPSMAAAESWYRLAIQLHGDTEAEFRLGRMELSRPAAWRVPSDEEWVRKEADRKGLPYGAVWFTAKPATNDDKVFYQLRPGIVEGGRRLDIAARRGHAEAQYTLGMALTGGIELPLDMVAGIIWLEAAAAQGHPEAMMALAGYAAKGQGFFAKDPVRAYVMYDLAATSGEEGASAAREAVAKSLTQRQINRAKLLIQEFRDSQGL